MGMYMVIAIFALGMMTACSSDDDDNGGDASALNGTWKITKYIEVDGGNERTTVYDDNDDSEYVKIDGSNIKFYSIYNGVEDVFEHGTFTLSGNKMTLYVVESDGDDDVYHYTYKLQENNNVLVLRDPDDRRPDEYYSEWYYKRIN